MECCEGDLWDDVFWRYDFFELRMRIQLKFGQIHAQAIARHNSTVQIMKQVLGGSSKGSGSGSGPVQGVDLSGGIDQAAANINQLLSFA